LRPFEIDAGVTDCRRCGGGNVQLQTIDGGEQSQAAHLDDVEVDAKTVRHRKFPKKTAQTFCVWRTKKEKAVG